MISHIFSEDFSRLNSKQYLEVYEEQNLNHQDYFHHPEFQYACISIFSKYTKCYLLSVFKGEKLVGYAALRTTKRTIRKINYKFLVPVAFSVAEYNYPIIHKNYIDEFLKVLDKALANFNVHFQHVPGFFKKRILDNINDSFVSRVVDNPILVKNENDIFNASMKSTPLKRKRQLMRKYDSVETKHITSGINEELLNSFYQLHIKRWKIEGIASNFKRKEYRDIYKVISNLKINKIGYPILSYLKVNDNLVAFQYGYIMNEKYLAQIHARSLNDNYRSAGSILIKEILNYISSKEMKIYDMGVGLEDYKYRYMNDLETYFDILKFKSSFYSLISRINLK